jgi:hypothetical protein
MDGAVFRYADGFKRPPPSRIPLRCAVPEVFDGAGRRMIDGFQGLNRTTFSSIV